MSTTVTREQYLEFTCKMLHTYYAPVNVRCPLVLAASFLKLPDPEQTASVLLEKHEMNNQPDNPPMDVSAPGVVEGSVKIGKGKRQLIPYNVIVVWFSDFASHYGWHPAVLKVKADNPAAKLGPGLTAAFQKTLPSELLATVRSVLKPFCVQHSQQQSEGGDTVLQAYKKYVETHPEADIGRVLGLEADPQYKTDPAKMKAQAAEARRLAQATPSRAPPAPTATDVNMTSKVERELLASAPAPMQTPMAPQRRSPNKTEKAKEEGKRARDEDGKEDGEEAPKKKKAKSAGAEGEEKGKKEKKIKAERKAKEEMDSGKVEGVDVNKEKKEKKDKVEKRKEKVKKRTEKGAKHKKDEKKHREKKQD